MNYSFEKQKLLLEYMISSEEVMALCSSIIEPSFFDLELSKVVRFIISHMDDYKRIPNIEMIKAETGVTLSIHEDIKDKKRIEWVLDEIEKFCRTSKVIEAVTWATDKISTGDLDGLEEPIKDAVLLSLHRDMGTEYFLEPEVRLTKMLETNKVSSGWRDLDFLLYGGFEPGTLSLFMGGPGAGKSYTLSNLALNYMIQGHNVAYISLELSEDLICQRFDSMISGVPFKDVLDDIDNVSKIVRYKKEGTGNLWIKKMSKNETSMREVEAYIKELEIKFNGSISVFIIDYLDLLKPKDNRIDINNVFNKDKYVSEEMIGYAEDVNLLGFSASQLGRASVGESEQHIGMTAGGISKVNTAHNVISIYKDKKLTEKNQYKMTCLKTRTSAGAGKDFYLKYDPNTMRFSDIPATEQLNDKLVTTKPRSNKSVTAAETSDRLNKIRTRIVNRSDNPS